MEKKRCGKGTVVEGGCGKKYPWNSTSYTYGLAGLSTERVRKEYVAIPRSQGVLEVWARFWHDFDLLRR